MKKLYAPIRLILSASQEARAFIRYAPANWRTPSYRKRFIILCGLALFGIINHIAKVVIPAIIIAHYENPEQAYFLKEFAIIEVKIFFINTTILVITVLTHKKVQRNGPTIWQFLRQYIFRRPT